MDTKLYLLPVMGFWASTISNLQSHLLTSFLQKTVEAIQVGQKFTFCFYQVQLKYQINCYQTISQGSSPNLVSNIRRIKVNLLTSIPTAITRKTYGFLIISGGIDRN